MHILLFSLLWAIVPSMAAPLDNARIIWGLCNETEIPASLGLDCTNLQVPLDYSNSSSTATLNLELARMPAAIQPSRGSILFNFGGPGVPGRTSLAGQASALLALTGGEYDLVTFDPRGTGNTIPFLCYDTEVDAATLMKEWNMSNASEVELGNVWAQATMFAERCAEKMSETGPMINTPFGARDLISVVDALGEDGMLRYWGISYGTNLGATVAAMFPDRIDRMVLDAVANTWEYYHALADFEQWVQSDFAFSGIFQGCVARPQNCSLARNNESAAELEQATWLLLDRLKYNPIPLGGSLPTGGLVMSYDLLKILIQTSFYNVHFWPPLTTLIDILLQQKEPLAPVVAQTLRELVLTISPNLAQSNLEFSRLPQAAYGIHCVDRTARAATLQEFESTVDKLYNISSIFGDGSVNFMAVCAQWQIEPKERYEGNFQAKTKGAMLLVGNSGDGHTPVASAWNVSANFEGSEVLVVDGYGHGCTAAPSSCTLQHVQAYWANGTLPSPGTACPVEAKPFAGITWEDVFAQISDNGRTDSGTDIAEP